MPFQEQCGNIQTTMIVTRPNTPGSDAWCMLPLCLTLLLIHSARTGRSTRPSTHDLDDSLLDTRAPTGPFGDSSSGDMSVEHEAGFELYDEADGHEREAVQPPMELSDEVLTLLKSFDVDPVRGTE